MNKYNYLDAIKEIRKKFELNTLDISLKDSMCGIYNYAKYIKDKATVMDILYKLDYIVCYAKEETEYKNFLTYIRDEIQIIYTEILNNKFILKKDLNDCETPMSSLNDFIKKNEYVDRELDDNKSSIYQYNNIKSNLKYIRDLLGRYVDENDWIFKNIVIKDFVNNNLNKTDLNICIVGGGNLYELDSINKAAKIYFNEKNKQLNVTIIDQIIWPKNLYTMNDKNNLLLKYINRIELILNDYFDELQNNNKFDIVVFSRVFFNFEYDRYEKHHQRLPNEKSKKEFCDRISSLINKLLKNGCKVISIGYGENSNIHELDVNFEDLLFNCLRDNGIKVYTAKRLKNSSFTNFYLYNDWVRYKANKNKMINDNQEFIIKENLLKENLEFYDDKGNHIKILKIVSFDGKQSGELILSINGIEKNHMDYKHFWEIYKRSICCKRSDDN